MVVETACEKPALGPLEEGPRTEGDGDVLPGFDPVAGGFQYGVVDPDHYALPFAQACPVVGQCKAPEGFHEMLRAYPDPGGFMRCLDHDVMAEERHQALHRGVQPFREIDSCM